jgi:hypothetical protein
MFRRLTHTPAPLALSALSTLALAASLSVAGCKAKEPPATAPTPSANSSSKADLFASPDDLLAEALTKAADGGPDDPSAHDNAESADAPAAEPTFALKSAGAEPRSVVTYDFALGKAQTVVLAFTTTVKQEGGSGGGGDMPPLRLTLSVVAKERPAPDRTAFEAHVTKAEIPPGTKGIPAEAMAEMSELSKMLGSIGATLLVSKRGIVEDVSFSGDPEAQNAAMSLLSLLEEAFDLFFVPMPEEAVGIGAEWTMTSETPPGTPRGALVKTYSLKARTATTATLQMSLDEHAPEQPIQDPQSPPGATIAATGKESSTVSVRLTGVASKASSDAETVITTRDPSTTPPGVSVARMKRGERLEAP